jgi:hypothetical protein
MKPGVVAAAVVAVVSGISVVGAQGDYMLAGFDIAVTRTATGMSLACKAFPANGTSIRINEYGMVPTGKAVSGQDRPDLSGVWIQVDPPLSSESSHVVQIEQKGPVFKVKVETSGVAGPAGYSFRGERTDVIGSPPASRKDNDGRARTVSVDWEGDALVFVRTTLEGANATTEREIWSISTDGTHLTRARRTTDWKGTSTTQSTFQRRR